MSIDVIGEFLGTMVLVLLGNGVVANNSLKGSNGEGSGWLLITFGWGLAVMVAVTVSGFFSPAHINPAVSIANAVIGNIGWGTAVQYIIAQMLGAMLGQLLVYVTYQPLWADSEPGAVFSSFATAPVKRSNLWNFLTEAIGTAVLVIGALAMTPNELTSGLGPFVIGGVVLAIGMSLGGPTGYAINPARDLGPRIVYALLPMKNKASVQWDYSWIPVLGPIAGGVVAALLYNLVLTAL